MCVPSTFSLGLGLLHPQFPPNNPVTRGRRMMRFRLIPPGVSAFVLAVALNSCGGGGDSSGPPAPAPVASVEITPSPGTIAVSQTVQLTAATKDAKGNVLNGRVVTWSQGNGTVATVNSSGLVSAVGVGATTITATSEG